MGVTGGQPTHSLSLTLSHWIIYTHTHTMVLGRRKSQVYCRHNGVLCREEDLFLSTVCSSCAAAHLASSSASSASSASTASSGSLDSLSSSSSSLDTAGTSSCDTVETLEEEEEVHSSPE